MSREMGKFEQGGKETRAPFGQTPGGKPQRAHAGPVDLGDGIHRGDASHKTASNNDGSIPTAKGGRGDASHQTGPGNLDRRDLPLRQDLPKRG